MTVGELKKALKQFDDNLEVFTKKQILLATLDIFILQKKIHMDFLVQVCHVYC